MCQGYLHEGWAKYQAKYYTKMGLRSKYHNSSRWKKMASTIMGDYCLDNWDRRNKSLHGERTAETRVKLLEQLRKRVGHLFKKKTRLNGSKLKEVFKMPKEKRQNMGIHVTKLWIDMAEEALRLHREEVTKNKIHPATDKRTACIVCTLCTTNRQSSDVTGTAAFFFFSFSQHEQGSESLRNVVVPQHSFPLRSHLHSYFSSVNILPASS